MAIGTRSICNLALRPAPLFRQLPIQSSSICIHARYASILSSISDNPGAYNKRIRRGRGPGSGKGKTSGRGHKGQGQHGKVPAGFTGGQSTYEDTHGTRGFDNPFSEDMTTLNLDRLQSWIDQGRINPSRPITLIELVRSGCIGRIADGVKLLARGSDHLKTPVHIIVSRASPSAISAIENLGGTVTTRYYTPFAIKNILRGKMHPAHSRLFQPTPITQLIPQPEEDEVYALPDPVGRKNLEYYRDSKHRGYLSYQVPVGQTPSLYFKTPGVGVLKGPRTSVKKHASSDTLW